MRKQAIALIAVLLILLVAFASISGPDTTVPEGLPATDAIGLARTPAA